ncbi:LPXTG cell wall anchor domain-containing protein [Lactobacillus sp. YT155]|uniref:LPXTG cell wall anchor domain-containing protein n=1 Tax=Lactobacillus sp. YT155 TaxID=3060955 RepID=UPI00265E14EF|nr:LPXTG cell wall anchor domain-containing protein [Lactobacillus sp. YT155]MDO1605593.1 LPXTG cell wall anchor domain-containing protein [Lactobacillus sp. YT155]
MKYKKLAILASSFLLAGQLAMSVAPVIAQSDNSITPTAFPTGNFQGDFTIDAQSKTVSAGQTANFSLYLKSTGANTKLTNVDLEIQLPDNPYVTLSQATKDLKISGVEPKYDATKKVLKYHFDELVAGQVNKTVLKLTTVNGGFNNGSELTIKGKLTADSTNGKIEATTGDVVTVNSTKNLSLVNKVKSIYNNDPGTVGYHTNPAIGDTILWNASVGAPKKVEGSVFLKPGSDIKVTYVLDSKLEYISMENETLPQPTLSSDKHTLTWTLKAPSIAEQMANPSFMEQNLSMKLFVTNDKTNVFKDAINTLSITAEFNDGTTMTPEALDGKITISQSNPDTLPPLVSGGGYTSPHYGPIDDNGSTGGTSEFPDISVTDEATLGFAFLPGSLWNTSAWFDFQAYTVHYKIDPNLNIKSFYTGKFVYHPSSTVGSKNTPLKNQPHYSFNVRYDEDEDDAPSTYVSGKGNSDPVTGESVSYADAHKNNWHTLIADVPQGTWLSAKDLNIPAGKHVKEVMLHFHPAKGTAIKAYDGTTHIATGDEGGLTDYYESDTIGDFGQGKESQGDYGYINNWAPAGISANTVLHFNMSVKKGYIGTVQNSMYMNNRGAADDNYIYSVGSEYDWNNSYPVWAARSGPQKAEIVKPSEGTNRVLTTGVQFDNLTVLPDGTKNLIEGKNTVTASITNTATSKQSAPSPLVSYVLLPKGVEYTGNVAGSTETELVSQNYKSTGRSLVKVSHRYNSDYGLSPNTSISTKFNVNVTKSAVASPQINIYSFVNTEGFDVPKIEGSPVITDTVKEKDTDNMNGKGTDKPMFTSGRDYHFDKSSSLAVSTSVDGVTNGGAKKAPGQKAAYSISMKNTSDEDLQDLILMDTLPNVGDLSITTNEARGSQFNMTLDGPITLSADWKDKVNVTYSTSNNPKKAGILDKNTVYPSSAQKLADAPGAEDATWVDAKDVKDWSTIKSFKIELKDNSTWVSGSKMKIDFKLKVPAKIETAEKKQAQAASTDPAKPIPAAESSTAGLVASNSFAIAANSSQVIEPYKQTVTTKDPTAPADPEPIKPTAPKEKVETKTVKKSLPRTGEDIRNATILTVVGLIILAAIIYFVVKNRKNKKN